MLLFTLLVFYQFLIYSFTGYLVHCLLNKRSSVLKEDPIVAPGNTLLVMAGYVATTFLISILSLFMGIGRDAHLLLSGGIALGVLLFGRKPVTGYWILLKGRLMGMGRTEGFFYLAFYLILMLISLRSNFVDSDTGFYHAQAIQWIEKYPVVPGLANLFPSFAFNNSSFLQVAFFSFSWMSDYPLHTLNIFMVLLVIYYLLGAVFFNPSATRSKGELFIAVLFIGFLVMWSRGKVGLPFPDIMVGAGGLLALFMVFELMIKKAPEHLFFSITILSLWVLNLVTVKLSAMPFLLLIPIVLRWLWLHGETQKTGLLVALALILVVPWIIRSVVMSGYLVFPLTEFDFFDVDWKLPQSEALICRTWITSHSRIYEIRDHFDLSITQWFPVWWKNQHFGVFLLLALSLMWLPYIMVRTWSNYFRKGAIPEQGVLAVWWVSFAGLLFWWMTVPDPRFGFHFMMGCIGVGFYLYCSRNGRDWSGRRVLLTGLGAMTLMTAYFAKWPVEWIAEGKISPFKHWLMPEPLYKPEKTVAIPMGHFAVRIPEKGNRCWNEPIPCTCCPVPGLEARGTDPGDGFRMIRTNVARPVFKID